MNAKTQLIEKNESTGIAEFDRFERDLAEYKARYDVVYDLTIPEQDKQARSDRLAIGKTIARLDAAHKAKKEPLKLQVDLLDGERKRIKDGLLEVQDRIKSQIAAHEAKLQEIEDALNARVEAISALAAFEFPPASEQVQQRLDTLSAITIDDSFAHHEANAALAHRKSAEALNALLATVTKAEADAAELARLKAEAEDREREEREARIAAEAAEKAKQEAAAAIAKAEQDAKEAAARAEQQAKDAAEKAEREKREAVAAAESKAKRDAEAAEKARLDAIEKERIETERREANKKHCAGINNAAVDALIRECELPQADAKAVITAIAKGLIPAVKITY